MLTAVAVHYIVNHHLLLRLISRCQNASFTIKNSKDDNSQYQYEHLKCFTKQHNAVIIFYLSVNLLTNVISASDSALMLTMCALQMFVYYYYYYYYYRQINNSC